MFLLWLRQLPQRGDQTPLISSPIGWGQVQSYWHSFPRLVPSSYRVLRGSVYSFPLLRCSCLLSAAVLHALLCLKVYSWCIRGQRCTPRPPTPPPSCSLSSIFFDPSPCSWLLCCFSSKVFIHRVLIFWNSERGLGSTQITPYSLQYAPWGLQGSIPWKEKSSSQAQSQSWLWTPGLPGSSWSPQKKEDALQKAVWARFPGLWSGVFFICPFFWLQFRWEIKQLVQST